MMKMPSLFGHTSNLMLTDFGRNLQKNLMITDFEEIPKKIQSIEVNGFFSGFFMQFI